MLTKRVIACLDVKDGLVVKGVKFFDHVDAGDPIEQARRYQDDGADDFYTGLIRADIWSLIEIKTERKITWQQ